MLFQSSEPVLVLAAVRAMVVLVTAFGLDLSAEQVAAVYLAAESVLSLVAREKVTPWTPPDHHR
jgi:hypothetical protein